MPRDQFRRADGARGTHAGDITCARGWGAKLETDEAAQQGAHSHWLTVSFAQAAPVGGNGAGRVSIRAWAMARCVGRWSGGGCITSRGGAWGGAFRCATTGRESLSRAGGCGCAAKINAMASPNSRSPRASSCSGILA